jgi:GxxExxY protein
MNADDADLFMNQELIHKELTEKIIGVFFDVYNELGHGFLESVYRNSMQIALQSQGLRVECEVAIPVWFRGSDVGDFRADMIVQDSVLLELKMAQAIDWSHEAQAMNYLRATRLEVGLVLNFGPTPVFRRVVFSNQNKKIRVHPRESAVGNP